MKVVEVIQKPTSKHAGRIRPKVITWNKTKMLSKHSFLATTKEICRVSMKKDVVKIGVVGEEGSGKTTMAEAIGHAVHKNMMDLYKIPFAVRIFYEEDLLHFRETLKSLTPANYILIFDDISFLEGTSAKNQISAVKQAVTKIRHLEGGQDVKIILINNYHYTKGLDKYLRQAHFKYFTTVGSEEGENLEKMVGRKNMPKVKQFIKYLDQAMKTGTDTENGIEGAYWNVALSPKEHFRYRWQDPFIPALFYDNINLRHIISPKREFMDKICEICVTAKESSKANGNVSEFCKSGEYDNGEWNFKTALRLKMYENGMAVHQKRTLQAKKWIDLHIKKSGVSLEDIMVHYGWKIQKTRIREITEKILNDTDELKKKDDSVKSKPKIKQSIGKW